MTDTVTAPARLSILTVARNSRDHFLATADSLPRELPPWLHWVVVDGASTDGTLEAIRADGRARRCISEADAGVYDAYNKAWALAESDYVLYLNCGDTLERDAMRLLEAWQAGLAPDAPRTVHCYAVTMAYNARTWVPDPARLPAGMSVPTPGVLFPRAALAAVGGFDAHLRIAADFGALLAMWQARWPFEVHEQALVSYLGGGLSAQHRHLAFFEECMIQLRHGAQTSDEVLLRAARRAFLDIDSSTVPLRRWRLALELGRRLLY